MSPNFMPGDYVISFAWYGTRYQKGDVVVVKHPHYHTLIKRIAEINRILGKVLLSGDNPASTSSESLGWLKQTTLVGKVIFQITHRPSSN